MGTQPDAGDRSNKGSRPQYNQPTYGPPHEPTPWRAAKVIDRYRKAIEAEIEICSKEGPYDKLPKLAKDLQLLEAAPEHFWLKDQYTELKQKGFIESAYELPGFLIARHSHSVLEPIASAIEHTGKNVQRLLLLGLVGQDVQSIRDRLIELAHRAAEGSTTRSLISLVLGKYNSDETRHYYSDKLNLIPELGPAAADRISRSLADIGTDSALESFEKHYIGYLEKGSMVQILTECESSKFKVLLADLLFSQRVNGVYTHWPAELERKMFQKLVRHCPSHQIFDNLESISKRIVAHVLLHDEEYPPRESWKVQRAMDLFTSHPTEENAPILRRIAEPLCCLADLQYQRKFSALFCTGLALVMGLTPSSPVVVAAMIGSLGVAVWNGVELDDVKSKAAKIGVELNKNELAKALIDSGAEDIQETLGRLRRLGLKESLDKQARALSEQTISAGAAIMKFFNNVVGIFRPNRDVNRL